MFNRYIAPALSTFILLVSIGINGEEVSQSLFSQVEDQQGIPKGLLYAMALQESGRWYKNKRVVWPWTLNVGGKGYYFSSKSDACDALKKEVDDARIYQLGIGVGQHEWFYQKGRFHSICHALDPKTNIEKQAEVLLEFYEKTNTWVGAIALYHTGNINNKERTNWGVNYVLKVMGYHENYL